MLYFRYVFNQGGNIMATKAATSKKSVKPAKVSGSSLKLKSMGAPLKESAFIGALLAEVVGTFLLAAMFIISPGQPIFLLFALTGIALVVGTMSGAHLNPAVSLAAWVTRRVSTLRAVAYVVAQFAGAALAFGLLNYFVSGAAAPSAEAAAYGQTAPQLYHIQAIPAGKEFYVAVAEAVGLAILAFGYGYAFANKKDKLASSVAKGFSFFVALFIALRAASYVEGSAVLNPAVAMSVQAFSKFDWWALAVYVLAPVVGAVIGFALYDILSKNNDGGEN